MAISTPTQSAGTPQTRPQPVQPDVVTDSLADSAHIIFPVAILLLLFCVIWTVFRRRSARHRAMHPPDPRLLAACLGDRKLAKRLVRYELKRNPRQSESAAAAAAIARLQRDSH